MIEIAKAAMASGWSVRETECHARQSAAPKKTGRAAKGWAANVRDLESRFARCLGSPVAIDDHDGEAKIEVRYASRDELDPLLATLMR